MADPHTHPSPWQIPPDQPAAEQALLARLAEALQSQPLRTPRPELRQALLQQIRRPAPARLLWQWAGVLALALITLSLLWNIVQPGVQLRWSITHGEVALFRIYRVDPQAHDFKLVDEIAASPEISHYSLVDRVLLPGQDLEYIVEGLNSAGTTLQQQVTVSQVTPILLSQVALILASLMIAISVAYLLRAAARRLPFPPFSFVH